MRLLLLVLLAIPFSSAGQKIDSLKRQWLFSVSTSTGDKYYISSEPEGKQQHSVTIWLKGKLKSFGVGNRTYKNGEVKILAEFDCQTKMYKAIATQYYNSNGETIYSDEYDSWTRIFPDTVYETISKQLCTIYGLNPIR